MAYSRISLFDLDRTLFNCSVSFDFYLFLIKKKSIPVKTLPPCLLYYMKHRYFDLPLVHMHQLVFDQFLLKRSSESIMKHRDEFIDTLFPQALYMPAFNALKRAIHLGHYTAILTSSPQFIAQPIAERLGVNQLFASRYALDEQGDFASIEKIIEGKEKAKITHQLQQELEIQRDCVSAYSDSFYDIDFLACSGEKFAVNPDKRLKIYSIEQNWKII